MDKDLKKISKTNMSLTNVSEKSNAQIGLNDYVKKDLKGMSVVKMSQKSKVNTTKKNKKTCHNT